MNDILDADDITHALEKAIFALQQVAMAHPASDEHSRQMYRTCEDARRGLMEVLSAYGPRERPSANPRNLARIEE